MIYCVEDDNSIRELIVYTLQNTGFEAQGFETGEDLLSAVSAEKPRLILLDIMLPGQDGIAVLHTLKTYSETKSIPVIVVTAKTAEYDKVVGLDAGADDYISKPFGILELVSRIKAVLRRTDPMEEQLILTVGPITLDYQKRAVYANGEEVTLTLKEFELLKCLMEKKGAVIGRDELLSRIWGYEYRGETRTVDVHIRSLRLKLGEASHLINTVRGVGYRIGA